MHLWIYNTFHGEIQKGLVVRHKCNNKSCINPEHMLSGTYRDNAIDMVNSGITKISLQEDDVKEIKRLLSDGKMKQYEIAKMFNIDSCHVSKINRGIIWKNVV